MIRIDGVGNIRLNFCHPEDCIFLYRVRLVADWGGNHVSMNAIIMIAPYIGLSLTGGDLYAQNQSTCGPDRKALGAI